MSSDAEEPSELLKLASINSLYAAHFMDKLVTLLIDRKIVSPADMAGLFASIASSIAPEMPNPHRAVREQATTVARGFAAMAASQLDSPTKDRPN